MDHDQFPARYDGYLYHYYRAEVSRETNWRNRLDVTTNWSIVVSAAILSYMFGNKEVAHGAIILNYLIVLFFLYIESRRFRYYTMLKDRTRYLETHVFSKVFTSVSDGKDPHQGVDLRMLAANLERPRTTMSKAESISWRLRRVYIFLLGFLYVTWLDKLAFSPERTMSVAEMIDRANIWFMPGWLLVTAFTASFFAMLWMAIYIPHKSTADDLP